MIYLDHHSTTPLCPAARAAMLPLFDEYFANAGSVTHQAGREVAEMVGRATGELAETLGATCDEIVITSGATESNNLALFGTCLHPRQKRRKVVSLISEHHALLDPLKRLEKMGFQVELVPVLPHDDPYAGAVDMDRLQAAIDADTALVSVMLANNEIGTIQPLAEIARLCRRHDVLLHTDASQAVGRLPVNVDELDVDLLSFSGHKFYGPKGVGGLYVRQKDRRVRLQPQIVGGGQQFNRRSGTLNSPGIVGMSAALVDCARQLESSAQQLRSLRDNLFQRLRESLPQGVKLNGPRLDRPAWRLPGNLNCSFFPIEGQSLMLEIPDLAVSSGSACTSAEPAPSHVLLSLGLTEEQARSSLRFGLGRGTTPQEIEQAAEWLVVAVNRLRHLLD